MASPEGQEDANVRRRISIACNAVSETTKTRNGSHVEGDPISGTFPISWFQWVTPEPNVSNVFVDAFIKLAWGFLPALCVGYLVAIFLETSTNPSSHRFSKAYSMLLFACGTWSIILSIILDFRTGLGWGREAIDYVRILLIIPIIFSPISFLIGLPAFVLYAWKLRGLRSRTASLLVSAMLVTSCLYFVVLLSIDMGS
jgi:hypothetical protein